MPRYAFRCYVLRPIIRRHLPGTPLGVGSAVPTRELSVPRADSQSIIVTDTEEGPAILLVHAGSTDGSSWLGVAAALSERFRVLRFDRFTYRHDPPPTGMDAMVGGDALRRARAALDDGDPDGAIAVRFGERSGETEPGKPGHRAPGRLSTLSWIWQRRRCVRDFEGRLDNHEAMVTISMIMLMRRRLVRPLPRAA